MFEKIPMKRRIAPPFAAVILQSDDWGFAGWTFDESSANALGYAKMGVPYSHYGFSGMETETDLENLFSALESVIDASGLPAIMQANYIVTSPDYDRITAAGGKEWYALELPSTPHHWHQEPIIRKALEGISRGVWRPEYHGYSHCDMRRLLELVQGRDPQTRKSVALNCLPFYDVNLGREYASGAGPYVRIGLNLFQKLFGYRAISSSPPNYYISNSALMELRRGGIKVLQGIDRFITRNVFIWLRLLRAKNWFQRKPKRNLGFINSPRDLNFEPRGGAKGGLSNQHWDQVLCKARQLLQARGLLGISMHRLNFVHHDRSFSREGLRQLTALLHGLVNTITGLVFLTDEEYLNLKMCGFCVSKRRNTFVIRNFGCGYTLGYFSDAEFPGLSSAIRSKSNRGVIYHGCEDGIIHLYIQPGNHLFEL